MNQQLKSGSWNSLRASSTLTKFYVSKIENLIPLLLLVFTAVLFGCAGGTRGTGGAELTGFKGLVLLDSGEPVAGAAVTLINTGEFTQSADDGSFSVESDASGEVTFEISQGNTSGTVTISGVPAGSQVTFSVSIHTDDHHIDLDDVEIEHRGNSDNDSSDDNHNSNSSSSSGGEAEDDHGGNGHGSDDISDDRGDDNSSDSTDNSDDSAGHGGSGGGSDSSSGGDDDSGNDHGSNGGGGDDNGGNSGSGSGSSGNSGSGHGGRN